MIKLKMPINKVPAFADLLNTYDIRTLASWSTEDFFGETVSFIISVKESQGVTEDEKKRLINENFGKYIF